MNVKLTAMANEQTPPIPAGEERKPYEKPILKNHGNLRLISQMT